MRRIAPVVLALALLAGGCAGSATGPELPPLASKVRDLRDKGHHALARGDAAGAGLIFDDARRLAESLDDRPGLAGALNDLGAVAARSSARAARPLAANAEIG